MKIGIHPDKNSFSVRWITYCKENNISYKEVDCYQSDIIQQLSDCDALMWHFNHKGSRESKFAKQLLYSVQASGKVVFPDANTVWHFDDKVGQKYLLEAVDAPLAGAHVFYNQKEALEWAGRTSYPKVFKLRTGSGSSSVQLVRSANRAGHLIRKAFGRGFKQHEPLSNLKERIRKYSLGMTSLWDVIKGVIRIFRTTKYARVTGREKGYVYFQDFVPDNNYDIRIIVIGDKAFAIKRMVRKGDFRASGSGFLLYEKEHFDEKTIRTAFEVSGKLGAQCMTYDFVYLEGNPLIVEISYGFSLEAYDACTGYWDLEMNWYNGSFNPYGWMIEDLMNKTDA